MKVFFLFLLIELFTTLQAIGQDSLTVFQNFLNDPAVRNSPISICVENLADSSIVLDINKELSLTPASVQKIITTATAFQLLGKDFKFETDLIFRGTMHQQTLNGDLVIKGGGDPTLGSDYIFGKEKRAFFIDWVEAIKNAGIDTIKGDIVADPSIYTDQDVPQTWIWEDLGNYYGAAAKGITLYDNTFKLIFKTEDSIGGPTEVVRTEPFIPELKLQNDVLASNDNRDRSFVFGSPFDSYRIIRGTLPKGKEEFSVRASIPDPSLLLAYELKQKLEKAGIVITGASVVNQKKQGIEKDSVVLKWYSPPLHKIIRELNFFSVNLFAEHLCKHLGLVVKGKGTTKEGTKVIKEFWTNKGLNTNFMFLADGCGLSRANAVSSKMLVDVLACMNKDTINGAYFYNSLPIAGQQGTQQYYFKHSILNGKAHIKSGSMTRVRSFAGYLTTEKGTPVAFAIIVDNFDKKSFPMAHQMEKWIERIYLNY